MYKRLYKGGMDYGFVWDERKYRAVCEKYEVDFSEVVAVFEDDSAIEIPDPAVTRIVTRWSG